MFRKAIPLAVVIVLGGYLYYMGDAEEAEPSIAAPCHPHSLLSRFGEDKTQCPATRINRDDLLVGNPVKDGIPALDSPQFVSADETEFGDDELIIGLEINGEARAYPYAILNWHEIVNDLVGGVPVAVTYCPLCETNSVFIRRLGGLETTFGVSGGLYHSCLVMYDRATESLWVQPWGAPIAGKHLSSPQLRRVPAVRTTLGQWKQKHPATSVLSADTGYYRNYRRYPYGTFYTDERIYFPVRNQEKRKVHPKEISFVVFNDENAQPFDKYGGEAVAFTLKELREKKTIKSRLGEEEIVISYDDQLDWVKAVSGERSLAVMAAFGFVPPAFFE